MYTSPVLVETWRSIRTAMSPAVVTPIADKKSLREFVNQSNPHYIWYKHCEILCDALQRVAEGAIKRLLVFMPPREGKSELISRIFPAYLLYLRPEQWVGLNSYAADLAYTFSRVARDHFQTSGGIIRDDASAVKHWETTSGGGLWASGVGGPQTGKGFHWGIIDDPLKNAEEALSETVRSGHKDWYRSTFYTRRAPGAAIVIDMTRWHADDLVGWLLTEEESEPEGWHILNFPAIAEEHPQAFPVSCTVEPDWREPGEALCPQRFDLEALEKTRNISGPYFWSAMYQQRPIPAGGTVFKDEWWKFYDEMPVALHEIILSVDCAFKDETDSDFVVLQTWARVLADMYLLDQIRARLDFPATCDAVSCMSLKWPRASAKYIEDKANGPAVIATLKRKIPGLIAVNPEGGKLARAHSTSPYVASGNVFLPGKGLAAQRYREWQAVANRESWLPEDFVRTDWVSGFIAEHAAFPRGAYDDQVDAETQALVKLSRSLSTGVRRNGHPRNRAAASIAIAAMD